MSLLITCEFAGNRVPEFVGELAKAEQMEEIGKPAENSRDPASLLISQIFAERLSAPLLVNPFSPDLVDVTRSERHPRLFPNPIRTWSRDSKQRLIDEIHAPYRQRVRRAIGQIANHFSPVIHLSVRSFPLRQNNRLRRTDVGLLYDPAADAEVDFCLDWIDTLYHDNPNLRVRQNYPRRGKVDSLTKAMRTEFAGTPYLGIDVWFNRAWVMRPSKIRDDFLQRMCVCLESVTRTYRSAAA